MIRMGQRYVFGVCVVGKGLTWRARWRGQPYQVVKIMSGDPSRGAISLEMEEPLLTGQKVQVRRHAPVGTSYVR